MNLVSTAVCVSKLVLSLERVDGALLTRSENGKADGTPFVAFQAFAVSHNATIAADFVDEFQLILGQVNDVWQVLVMELTENGVDPAEFPPQQIRDTNDLF